MAAFGVETQTLVAALVGGTIGVSLAPPTSRVRAVFLFFAVVLACATFGTFLSDQFFSSSRIARNFCATSMGILFHPLLSAAIAGVPVAFTALLTSIASLISRR